MERARRKSQADVIQDVSAAIRIGGPCQLDQFPLRYPDPGISRMRPVLVAILNENTNHLEWQALVVTYVFVS